MIIIILHKNKILTAMNEKWVFYVSCNKNSRCG